MPREDLLPGLKTHQASLLRVQDNGHYLTHSQNCPSHWLEPSSGGSLAADAGNFIVQLANTVGHFLQYPESERGVFVNAA